MEIIGYKLHCRYNLHLSYVFIEVHFLCNSTLKYKCSSKQKSLVSLAKSLEIEIKSHFHYTFGS